MTISESRVQLIKKISRHLAQNIFRWWSDNISASLMDFLDGFTECSRWWHRRQRDFDKIVYSHGISWSRD